MKWIKKVAETPLEAIAKVIDSFNTGADKTTNAPSINVVETALNIKASADDLAQAMADVDDAIDDVETALSDKASTTDLELLGQAVDVKLAELRDDIELEIMQKADRAEMFLLRDYSYSYTIAAGAYLAVTAANPNMSTISGYKPIAIRKIDANSRYIRIDKMQAVVSGEVVGLTNSNSSAVSNTLNVTLVFVRNDVTEA